MVVCRLRHSDESRQPNRESVTAEKINEHNERTYNQCSVTVSTCIDCDEIELGIVYDHPLTCN